MTESLKASERYGDIRAFFKCLESAQAGAASMKNALGLGCLHHFAGEIEMKAKHGLACNK